MTEISTIKKLLKQVGLHNLAKSEYELADEQVNSLDYLELLLMNEIYFRASKNIYKRRKASGLPNKSFQTFEVNEAQGITKWQIDKLTTLEFLRNKTNIIISVTAGVGKTHIAASIGNVAVDKGTKTFYITSLNLLLALNSNEKKHIKILEYIKECKLVIIDEFMYTKFNEQDSQMMYHYLTNLNRTISVIIVTNKSLKEIPDYFSEKLLASTLMDRLTENSQIIILWAKVTVKRITTNYFNLGKGQYK